MPGTLSTRPQMGARLLDDSVDVGADCLEKGDQSCRVGFEFAIDELQRPRLRETPRRIEDLGGDILHFLARRTDFRRCLRRDDPAIRRKIGDFGLDLGAASGDLLREVVQPPELELAGSRATSPALFRPTRGSRSGGVPRLAL